jgi:hypothetical protein
MPIPPTPDWTKLTIPLEEVDVPRLLDAWRWLVDVPIEPVALTRFGDWFVTDERGVVHRVDILEGSFDPICESLAEYHARKGEDEELIEWFQDGMVYSAYERGLRPKRGEGLGYRVAPILGASTEIENVTVVSMPSWQLFMSQLHDKLRSVPFDARITKVEVDDSGVVELRFEPPRR